MGAFDPNLYKLLQSAAGLKTLKPAAGNWRYQLPYYLQHRKYINTSEMKLDLSF